MIYPFMTLNDGTEIVHLEMNKDGKVKVYMETSEYGKHFFLGNAF